jgi:general secretion pathway protein A
MYESFFGLKQAPFSIAPDPRYLYMSERHREALAHLLYGLGGVGGFVLLTGDIGAGKTTVCRCFLEQVPANCHVAYIFNPKLTALELLQSVCDEFRIPVTPAVTGAPTVKDYLDPLNRFLLETHAVGHRSVLVIDEAQNLSADVLEQLRLLTNLETNERKLLQIILIGQPELRDMVARPEMEQLAQRVTARYHLSPLDEDETARYLAHRLAVAGRKGVMPFDLAALQRIHQLSGGVPRRINLLADRTLLGAYAQGDSVVGAEMVERAAAEVFDRPRRPAESPSARPAPARGLAWRAGLGRGLVVGSLAGLVIGAVGVATYLLWPGGRAAGGAAPSPGASAPAGASGPGTGTDASAGAAVQPGAASAASAPAIGATEPASPGRPAAASAVRAGEAGVPVPASRLPVFDPATDWAALYAERDEAWRDLALHWVLALPPGEPCQVTARQQLACYRSNTGTLALLRQLDRPAMLKLVDAQGRAGRAMVLALNPQTARLAAGNRQWTVPVAQLERWWRGEFGTLWRMPAGFEKPLLPGNTGPAAQALAQALAALAGAAPPKAGTGLDPVARERLIALQRSLGLPELGRAGPTTFMVLNRQLGVVEPRLARE